MVNLKNKMNWSFTLPWVSYLLSIIVLISLSIVDYSLINITTSQVLVLYNLLLGGGIFLALRSTLPNGVMALGYTLYWLVLGIFFEYLYIYNGLLIHHNRSTFIIGIIPLMVVFYWLTLFFTIYSCSTFLSFFIKNKNRAQALLIHLLIDGFVMLVFTSLFEPTGQELGNWSWERPDYSLIFNIPIIVYIEYFFGIMLVMLPLRILEIYRFRINSNIYFKWFNFPLYMVALFFFSSIVFANGSNLAATRWLAIIYSLLFFPFMIFKIRERKKLESKNE